MLSAFCQPWKTAAALALTFALFVSFGLEQPRTSRPSHASLRTRREPTAVRRRRRRHQGRHPCADVPIALPRPRPVRNPTRALRRGGDGARRGPKPMKPVLAPSAIAYGGGRLCNPRSSSGCANWPLRRGSLRHPADPRLKLQHQWRVWRDHPARPDRHGQHLRYDGQRRVPGALATMPRPGMSTASGRSCVMDKTARRCRWQSDSSTSSS